MNALDNDYLTRLLAVEKPPCLSLYQPTHRHHPDKQQDPIRFRNLLKVMETSLRQKYSSRETQPLLEPFRILSADIAFWNHTLDGLAVLASPHGFLVYRLQRSVPELAIVATSFHVKPLMRVAQSADRYLVLGLNRRDICLLEGNRDTLDEIELAQGVPRTITDALGEDLTEPHITVASYGTGAAGRPIRHDHGSKKDEVDIDTERFFRAVDRAILEHHSRPSGLPLLLAALPEYHTVFRRISQNPFLMDDGMDFYPTSIPADAFRQRAWKAVEPRYQARLRRLVDGYLEAQSKGLGTDDPDQAAGPAAAGRVATLLVDNDRRIPGVIDAKTGRIEFRKLSHPDVDDILDDLGELVLKKGGHTVIIPGEQMPTRTGLAATYRF
jgi:Bacterial archaeo-eukaryotic release factor family 3